MVSNAATDAANPSHKKPLKIGKDELSLAMFPIGVVTDRNPIHKERNHKHYERTFESHVWSEQSRKFEPASVTLLSNPKTGLPTPGDEALFVALFNLALADGGLKPGQRYKFVPRQLLALMGKAFSGKNWTVDLPDGIERLQAVRLRYDYAWFDYENEEHITRLSFGLIATSSYTQRKGAERNANRDRVWVTFNDEFCRRMNEGSIKPLDMSMYFSFDSPTARRMYRIFDRYSQSTAHIEIDLKDFAFGHIGLSPAGYTCRDKLGNVRLDEHGKPKVDFGDLKRALASGLTQHEQRGTIKPTSKQERYRKISKGVWRICLDFKKRPRNTKRRTTTKPQNIQLDPLANQLVDRGVIPTVARQLVDNDKHPAEHINLHIEIFDWYQSRGQEKGPGFLRNSIEEFYTTPDDFKSKAQREDVAKRKQAENDKQRKETERHDAEAAAFKAEYQRLTNTYQADYEAASTEEKREMNEAIAQSRGKGNPKSVAGFRLALRRPNSMLYEKMEEYGRRHPK